MKVSLWKLREFKKTFKRKHLALKSRIARSQWELETQFKPIIEPLIALSSKINNPFPMKHEVKKGMKREIKMKDDDDGEARYEDEGEEEDVRYGIYPTGNE